MLNKKLICKPINFIAGLCLILTFCYPPISLAIESEGWKLKMANPEDNIQIYYRTTDQGNVEFRGETIVDSSLSGLVALMRDVESMKNWVHNVEKAKILEIINEFEAYSYVVNSFPFPFSSRDSVVRTYMKQDETTLAVTIEGKSEPTFIDEQDGLVRVDNIKSFWRFTPLEKGKSKVVFQGYGEPGGSIPANIAQSRLFRWLIETQLWCLPFFTLKNIKDEIKDPKYQLVQYSFIQEVE